MKIKDMSPDQLREYNRNQKQRSRERERQEQLTRQPNVNDYKMPEAKQKLLNQHAAEKLRVIKAELPDFRFETEDEYCVDGICDVLFGLENNHVQKVEIEGSIGMLIGGHFPDSTASTSINHVHRFPTLLRSSTFAELYKKFLRAVTNWHNQTHGKFSSPELIADLKAEVAGTYSIPVIRAPAPAPVPVEVPTDDPATSDDEIRERGRIQLLRQVDPNLPPAAIRFLDGVQ